jgi:hypothetical protein
MAEVKGGEIETVFFQNRCSSFVDDSGLYNFREFSGWGAASRG